MSAKKDRATGLPTGDPVVPPTSICFRIMVPNSVEHRSAFKGALSELGKAYNWYQEIGVVSDDANIAAELWRERIADAEYYEECNPMLDCDEVANCIETSPATQDALVELVNSNPDMQQALADQITNNTSTQQNVYYTSSIGVPMTSSQRGTAVSASDDCEPDSLFGSITALVEQLDKNNRDFLEIIEVGTNTRERLSSLIAAIPLIETLPIDDGIAMIDKLQSEILENYEAQWTTALFDEYRCDLFCAVKDLENCEVSFQALVEYWNNRLGTALEPINFFGAVLNYFLLGTWSGTTVVDIMMLIQLSAWQEASNWSGVSLRTLQTVGLLGANNPDADWELLCEDCAPEPVCGEVVDSADGWSPIIANYAIWIEGEGIARGTTDTLDGRMGVRKNIPSTGKKVTLTWNEPFTGFVAWGAYTYTYNPAKIQYQPTPTTIMTIPLVNEASGLSLDIGKNANVTGDPLSPTLRLISICIEPA